jgi:hypothetical protein
MNDEQLLDADPYRPVAGRLDGAEQPLLEKITSVPLVPSVPVRPLRRCLVGAVAAAAVVTGVIGASTLLPQRSAPPPGTGA